MEFATWSPLLWLALLLPMALALRSSLVDRPGPIKAASFVLRALGLALLALALCRPHWHDRSDERHLVFLVDVSESVELEAVAASAEEIRQGIAALGSGDTWSLFAFADGLRPLDSPEELTALAETWRGGLGDARFRSQTRLADALLGSRLAFPAGKAKRLAVFTDGQETGDRERLADALATLAGEGIDLRYRQLDGLAAPEAAVVALRPSSATAYEGEIVRMEVVAASNRAMPARLRLLHRGVAMRELAVDLEARPDNRFHLDVPMGTPGASAWTAELLPEADHFPANNQLSAVVEVRGAPRVLALHRESAGLRPLARALREQDIDLETRGAGGLPETMDELLAFDAVVLSDLPATELSPRQMELLQRYVTDFGGGLAMLGSDRSFGLGGYYKTPVEEVLPLVSRFEKEEEKPSLAMVLVIDKSGSMQGAPIHLAREAAKAAVELLGPRDQIAVIGFDSAAQVVCELRPASDRHAVQDAIDSLAAGGGTDVYPAMVVGRDMLETAAAQLKHMIVLSDGMTRPADHLGLTQAMVDAGITVSTVGLGEGGRGEAGALMARIAETGRGRYHVADDPESVPRIFTMETTQASKSAIKEDVVGVVAAASHPAIAGYEEADLPFALGYVMTEAKPTAQVLLVAESGDPLLAVSRYGLGVGMAYASDLTEKWGGEWLAWEDCGKFWAQVLRAALRRSDAEGLRAVPSETEGRWRVDIFREDPDRTPVSGVAWDATVLRDGGAMSPVEVEETGLGRYRVEIPLGESRTLSLRLHDRDSDKLQVLHHSVGYPLEYRLGDAVPPELAALPAYNAARLGEGLAPVPRHRPVSHWFAFAALACVWTGLLLRRGSFTPPPPPAAAVARGGRRRGAGRWFGIRALLRRSTRSRYRG